MGQGGEEVKLGNDLDFDSLKAEGENILGESSPPSHFLLRAVNNEISETVKMDKEVRLDSSMSGGAGHCWDHNGEFHIVCVFVVAVGIACSFLTLCCAYKIYKLFMDKPESEPASTASSVKMINSRKPSSSSTKTHQSQSFMVESDRIDTVQTDMVVMHNKVDDTADISMNNCLC